MIKTSDLVIAGVVLAIIMLIMTQLSTTVLDVLLSINIAISIMVLMAAIYAKDALDLSVFPTLLLLTTLYRLTLNLNSTRLILMNDGDAGNIVRTFGEYVTGGNMIIGVVMFVIIIIVQFTVITKGAERVSEVAARFTLDAMPGKQMAIDADLNSGLIDEAQATERRTKIQRAADFYGAMDGAMKFVKGDAVVGILITFVNVIGGIVIGMIQGTMPLEQVLTVYTNATIGDGLVSQLPALMISTASGIIVTRAASDGSLGDDLKRQLFQQPAVMLVVGIALIMVALIPGMPWIILVLMGSFMIGFAFFMYNRKNKEEATPEPEQTVEETAAEKRKPESVVSLLQVNQIELELGYGIIPLVDESQGGDLLDRVIMIRRQCALDMGIIVPVIRMRDNIQLRSHEYMVKIKGVEVARGEVMADHFLALNSGAASGTIMGIETVEPAFGLPALWITDTEREKAELMGYTTIDPPSVIATHLTEVVKRHANELLGRQQVQTLIDNLKQSQPALVDDVIPKMFSLGEVQKVLANLLKENISIRDLSTIVETLADYGGYTRDCDLLTEYVRQNLKRAITRRFVPDNKARVITLAPGVEQMIADRVKTSEQGSYVAMEPELMQRLFLNLKTAVERMTGMGISPIVLTSPTVRRHFKRITEQLAPDLTVLAYSELEQNVEIYADGVVNV